MSSRRVWLKSILLVLVLAMAAGARFPEIQPVEKPYFVYYVDHQLALDDADRTLTAVRSRLYQLLGDTLRYRPSVYILDDLDYFEYLVGGRFPDWGAAAAIPTRGMIVVKSPFTHNIQRPLTQLLAHEYAHLVTAQRTGFYQAPRWFDEGLAMLVSTEWSWSDNMALSRAAVFGGFLKLDDIQLVNRFDESKAHLAYAEAYLAVQYLFDEYGATMVRVLLDQIASGANLDQALTAATGADEKEFEAEFTTYLQQHYNLATLFSDTMLFWVGLALIVVIAFILYYRRRQRYYRQWEAEEKLQSTDFDYGDVDRPEEADDDEPWQS